MTATPHSSAPSVVTRTVRILLVDDSESMLQTLGKDFQAGGYTPVMARDGIEAKAQLERHPDIVLAIVDLHMPRMNGQELLEHVRTIPGLESLPIVMLTTDRNPANLDRAVKGGAVGWVLKPYLSDRLVETVGKIIRLAQRD